jgi:hypothetical protein
MDLSNVASVAQQNPAVDFVFYARMDTFGEVMVRIVVVCGLSTEGAVAIPDPMNRFPP